MCEKCIEAGKKGALKKSFNEATKGPEEDYEKASCLTSLEKTTSEELGYDIFYKPHPSQEKFLKGSWDKETSDLPPTHPTFKLKPLSHISTWPETKLLKHLEGTVKSWYVETPQELSVPLSYKVNPIPETPKAPAVWTLIRAMVHIREWQKQSRDYGYHVCLGGSVLTYGESSKDLDLYFLPMESDGSSCSPLALLTQLGLYFGCTPEPISEKYPSTVPYAGKIKLQPDFLPRIDVFIMGTEVHKETIELFFAGNKSPDTIEIDTDHVQHFKKGFKV